ncbi:MAG: VTT domain-containing protein [Dehalococcoidia bacterium]|jgi:membrane protein YqaA with SNARE-associated domain
MEGRPEKNLERGEEIENSRPNRLTRFAEWIVEDRRRRIVAGAITTVVLVVFAAAVLILQQRFKGLGYVGLFFVNLASTAVSFLFIPGLTLAGQALIVSDAKSLGALRVGIVGGLGMGLGEITAYVVGAVGRDLAHGRRVAGPAWFRRSVEGVGGAITLLLTRHGSVTLFLLAVIPNPLFEVAGFSAGAVRMSFWRFLVPVMLGKLVRGLALAYLGAHFGHVVGL